MQHCTKKPNRAMDILIALVDAIKANRKIDANWLQQKIRAANDGVKNSTKHIAKKQLMPLFLANEVRFQLTHDERKQIISLLQAKPRRTASGVATITVLTKPWPCKGACVFCPNDLRMPKSYLANEPACQRAEANFFDPYLQVQARLEMLHSMGHITDKIELIVLGGTFSDYSKAYQTWFAYELFRALNDGVPTNKVEIKRRKAAYKTPQDLIKLQRHVNMGKLTYNEVIEQHPYPSPLEHYVSTKQLKKVLKENEHAHARCVGLSFEIRPDSVTKPELTYLRSLGATKIQIGVQSTRDGLLSLSHRSSKQKSIREAFALLRLFGFKIQAHFMVNLPGRTKAEELEDYQTFVEDPAYMPDEIKLYPTSLIEGTQLEKVWLAKHFEPYTTEELADILTKDLLLTPPFIRVSRVIRDFSAEDILAGNKLGNLRQMIEASVAERGEHLQEIRSREVALAVTAANHTHLDDYVYTTIVSEEHFLQMIDDDGRLHGFLRLSLPNNATHAMIRELHVYGRVAALGNDDTFSQHQGLGTHLLQVAEQIANQNERTELYVISAIGTQEYYRSRGFKNAQLYQKKEVLKA